MKRIWLTTDGRPHDSILAVFSSAERAERYRQLLVERYSLGKNLSLWASHSRATPTPGSSDSVPR